MRYFLSLVIFFLILTPSAEAQLQERLTIDMQPKFPESNTPLSLSVRSISMDLSRATISWFVNGARVSGGPGEISVNASTGNLGTKTTIRVELEGEGGEFLTATRIVQPAEIDLLWEADTYAPPLYRGKKLASSGAGVRAEALARFVRSDGTYVPTRDIIFTWRRNDAVVTNVSGRGKSSAVFDGPELFGTDTITVEAASIDNTLLGAATALIPSRSPFLVLYQVHPLFGAMYHQAVEEQFTFSDTETTLIATPYFAGATSADDKRLSYAWRINRAPITSDENTPSQITINADGSDGSARVELSVTHSTDFVMDARGLWRLVLNNGLSGAANDLFGR